MGIFCAVCSPSATQPVALCTHYEPVLAAALAVFLMLSIASVGAFVVRFMAGVAALLGCLGLLVIALTLLLLYRIMENPVSNFALLIVAGAWAWWFVAKKRREEQALRPSPRGPSSLQRLGAAIGRRLSPPPSGVRPSIAPVLSPNHERTRPPRTRSDSVTEAMDRRRIHHPRPRR